MPHFTSKPLSGNGALKRVMVLGGWGVFVKEEVVLPPLQKITPSLSSSPCCETLSSSLSPTAAEMSLQGVRASRTHLCSAAQPAVARLLASSTGSKDPDQRPGLPTLLPGMLLLY